MILLMYIKIKLEIDVETVLKYRCWIGHLN